MAYRPQQVTSNMSDHFKRAERRRLELLEKKRRQEKVSRMTGYARRIHTWETRQRRRGARPNSGRAAR